MPVFCLYERRIQADAQRDAAYDKITEMRREKYQLVAELEEEKGKNQKRMALISKEFKNSSIPSSAQTIRKKKIPNNREVTGRKPGYTGHSPKSRYPPGPYGSSHPPVSLMTLISERQTRRLPSSWSMYRYICM